MCITRQTFQIGRILLLLGTVGGHRALTAEVRYERAEPHMGTEFSISLYSNSPQQADRAFRAAFARIKSLDERLSHYRSDSEVSRLSDGMSPDSGRRVSPELWEVLDRGQQISRMSQGAFDMTLGPVTRIWRRARRRGELPEQHRLEKARQATGFQMLVLDESNRSVRFTQPGMSLDLSAIAKGFALDQAMIELKQTGIRRALINGGGDLLASDAPPDSPGWRVGLVGLRADEAPTELVRLANRAIATSGDLWQFVEIAGVRYSHLIDPKTGIGLTHRSSVTVIANTAMDADAVASAVSVLGPQHGLAFLNRHGLLEGRLVYERDGRSVVCMTPEFQSLVEPLSGAAVIELD